MFFLLASTWWFYTTSARALFDIRKPIINYTLISNIYIHILLCAQHATVLYYLGQQNTSCTKTDYALYIKSAFTNTCGQHKTVLYYRGQGDVRYA